MDGKLMKRRGGEEREEREREREERKERESVGDRGVVGADVIISLIVSSQVVSRSVIRGLSETDWKTRQIVLHGYLHLARDAVADIMSVRPLSQQLSSTTSWRSRHGAPIKLYHYCQLAAVHGQVSRNKPILQS